jgi:uncharacterized protein YoaH (UPF0181 family)
MAMRKNCPVCGVENTGGKIHTWHTSAHRKKQYSVEQIAEMSARTLESNQVRSIVAEAVDLARQPDGWEPKPKKSRKEYHREYYWRHAVIRRQQRVTSKMMRRKLQSLISDLCHAVDLGRITASW